MLDLLCFSGEVGWARLAPPPRVNAASRVHHPDPSERRRCRFFCVSTRVSGGRWRRSNAPVSTPRHSARLRARCSTALNRAGASFLHELTAEPGPWARQRPGRAWPSWWRPARSPPTDSEGCARWSRRRWGLRVMPWASGLAPVPAVPAIAGGRWARVSHDGPLLPRDEAVEHYASTLLARYGIVFRRLLAREPYGVAWRELVRVYRRLEARGEIRGGRFVAGMSGEQFAMPEAVERAREVRRRPCSGESSRVSGADPLNLAGIVTGANGLPPSHPPGSCSATAFRLRSPRVTNPGGLGRTLKPSALSQVAETSVSTLS